MQTLLCGVLVIDKPTGITSRDALNQITRLVPKVKIGHAGTLDPMASGVLVVCLGAATRLISFVQRMPKHYTARLRLGQRSSTDDVEGSIEEVRDAGPISPGTFEAVLRHFRGEITQVPPQHSAVHVAGRRSYELARQGRAVPLAPRTVRIDRLTCSRFEYPSAELDIVCSSGTYVRSLARDVGDRLGCGAMLTGLVRTAVGPFHLDDAISVHESDAEAFIAQLLPPSAAVQSLPRLDVPQEHLDDIAHGRVIPFSSDRGLVPQGAEFALYDSSGAVVAVAQHDVTAGVLRPRIVLIGDELPGQNRPSCSDA